MSLLAKFALGSIVVFVVVVGSILLFTARPTPILGMDGDALGHSVDKGNADRTCRKLPDGDWSCLLTGNKEPTRYRVDTNWLGCWTGTRTSGPVTTYSPKKISGCVDMWDHLRLEDTFN